MRMSMLASLSITQQWDFLSQRTIPRIPKMRACMPRRSHFRICMALGRAAPSQQPLSLRNRRRLMPYLIRLLRYRRRLLLRNPPRRRFRLLHPRLPIMLELGTVPLPSRLLPLHLLLGSLLGRTRLELEIAMAQSTVRSSDMHK